MDEKREGSDGGLGLGCRLYDGLPLVGALDSDAGRLAEVLAVRQSTAAFSRDR